jgi:hypothetical protein
LTVEVRDNEACLLPPRWFFVPVTVFGCGS